MRRGVVICAMLYVLSGTQGAVAQDTARRLAVLTLNPAAMDAIRSHVIPQLARQGFTEGRNLRIDVRIGAIDALPGLARELVALSPDVILAIANQAVDAARAASPTVPIVMFGQDPVGAGYAASLARPGGQVTGVAILTAELDVKRLELLRDVVPAAHRVAVLVHKSGFGHELRERTMNAMAAAAKLELTFLYTASSQEYTAAFASMRAAGSQLLVISASSNFSRDVEMLAGLALDARLPTVCEWQEMAASGCLLGYGPSRSELYRLSANYIARILKGAAPGELPIEEPANFELGVNMRVARALGVAIPPALLVRADEVTE